MRMPSAKLPYHSGIDTEPVKGKESGGLIGRMRRTLKRGGSKSPKEEPSRDAALLCKNNSFNGVTFSQLKKEGSMEFNRDQCQGLDNDPEGMKQNGDVNSRVMCQYNRCDVINGNSMNGMDHCNGRMHELNGMDYEAGRYPVNGRVLHENDGQNQILRRNYSPCCNGGAEFERQGARPKTGLYRKKSSPAVKSSDGSTNTVVLNVQANGSGDGTKGNNVIADVHLRVGGLMEESEDSESAYHVPVLQQRASFRKDISVKVFPTVGIESNSDVTVNCSVNVHCHISGVGEEGESEYVNTPGQVEDALVGQQNRIISSAELEPLVIQMTQQPENELPKHPRTPHIAEVMMRDSLASIESDQSSRSSSVTDSLNRDSKTSNRGQQETNYCNTNFDKSMQEKLKLEKFDQVVLLPKDSQIVNVVTTHKDSVCDEDDVRFEYSLPRSVSEGAAIMSSYRNDDVLQGKGMYGPAIDRRTKPRSTYGDYAQPDSVRNPLDEDEMPPPIPPRMSMALDDGSRKEEWETEPTHMCLPALMNGLYRDPDDNSASSRSKSLPRHSSLNDVTLDPELPRRSKTAHLKNRVSQLFKTPRRKSCAFPDRPLPDVPAKRAGEQVQARNNRRNQIQRPQSLYCPTEVRSPPIIPPPPARPCPQRPNPGSPRQPPPRPPAEQMVEIEWSEGFPLGDEVARCREFATSLRRISECGWYWGPMSWDDAEMRLENTPDGSFLVRDSSDDRHILSLTFRVQGSTHHTRIEHHNGKFSFWSQPTTHGSSSIVEFIEEAMRHSRNGRFLYFLRPRWPGLPPVPLQLLYPISRFQKARSLQHMCRFVIRRHVRLDHIDGLPLPRRLKEYLREGQYYTPDDIKP